MTWTSIHEELFKKINQEMDDYQGRVQSLPGHAVYNRAEEIAAMGFCYNQLMSGFHDHRAEELAPLLELEKPLETLSLRWMTEQQSRNFNEDFDQILHKEGNKMSVKTAQSTLRVAVYSLVCYDGEKDPVSLAAQRDRYAKKLAENPNWVITEWFSDEITFDESEETPANFQRMLQRCREGKIDIILTKSVLRFARDAQGTITRVRELRDLGVSVIFEREDIDSRSPDCEQLITL